MNATFTLKEIKIIAENILKKVSKNNLKTASMITLSGSLGVGKTTITQEIGKLLGVKEKITSPTFVIMKKYNIKNKTFKYLIHIDAYRLKNSQELFNIGWNELFFEKENLIIIEWPENVPECINDSAHKVILEHKNKQTRTIKTLL